MDFIPYWTHVFYWYSYGRQQSIFVGLGLNPGQGTYNDRQDSCLYGDQSDPQDNYADFPQYAWQDNRWVPQCCDGKIPGIAPPRPDWVAASNGAIMASITGNSNFGLAPNDTLNLIACPFQRTKGVDAVFWVWFTSDQAGVLFSEANFVDSTMHSLQLIDYTEFKQNASISPSDFSDPCPTVPACPTAAARAALPALPRIIGPYSQQ